MCRFVEEYGKHGVPIWGLTTQNEPSDGNIYRFPFQAMGWTPEMQRDFVKLDLGPALHSNGLQHVQLMIMDDQRLFLPYWAKVVSMRQFDFFGIVFYGLISALNFVFKGSALTHFLLFAISDNCQVHDSLFKGALFFNLRYYAIPFQFDVF